jgi:DNA-directed RNA polymerase subunit H
LDIDVFSSNLSPKYRVIKPEDAAALLEKFHITTKELPKIKLTDPAVKKLNANEGDIIEIMRASMTAGEAKYYRFVIK